MPTSDRKPLAEMLDRRPLAEAQQVRWNPTQWLATHEPNAVGRRELATNPALADLVDRAGKRGLFRSDVTAVAEEPLDLLIASMVWGFGPLGYGPARTAKMLATKGVASLAAEIVETVRTRGAGPGFSSLFKPSGSGRIYGLAVAMGPKLLYFACRDGNSASPPTPRPMIYDQWVYAGLAVLPRAEQPRLNSEVLPSPKDWVSQAAYETWCEWVAERAEEHNVLPEDVEYALFREGNPNL